MMTTQTSKIFLDLSTGLLIQVTVLLRSVCFHSRVGWDEGRINQCRPSLTFDRGDPLQVPSPGSYQ